LMPYLPFRVRQERPLFIRYVVANPANGDEFVVSLFDAGSMEGYLFSFDRGTGELSHLLTLHHNAGQSAGFTPDGRWLVITGNSQTDLVSAGVATTLYLFDWQEQAMEPIYIRRAGHYPSSLAYDWSSDGRWLAALAGSDYVLLMAPEDGHRRLIRHNAGECVSLIWQNREGDG
jgi:WD40 repeat protein